MHSTADIALDARIERVCRHLQASVDEPSLQELADIAGCSPTRLHRLFKQATGLTPKQYATALRADRLREGLQHQDRITDAFHEAGFGSSGRFYENAPRLLGMTPKRWRAGGGGEVIHFARATCQSRGSPRLCQQPSRGGGSLPPRGATRRRSVRLRLGRGTQA